MEIFVRGRYRARIADSDADMAASQNLRALAFDSDAEGDSYDLLSDHILIEEINSDRLVASCRVMQLASGCYIENSYSAQFYDLSALANFNAPMLELGRFCTDPDYTDPDIVRMAWAMMTRIVDGEGIRMLFGCSSFSGCDAGIHSKAFALLKRHQAPEKWQILPKANEVVPLQGSKETSTKALRHMPPLLRTYLAMGGWVSDHAVVDRDMNTLHVFTAVEISAIPEGRKRVLRAVAQ